MAQGTIYNNKYDELADLSIVDSTNFNARLTPLAISNKFLSCRDIDKFYSTSLFLLHLYSSLYLALFKEANTINNDVTKFKYLINNLKINFNNSKTDASSIGILTSPTYTLGSEVPGVFTFYINKVYNTYKSSVTGTTSGDPYFGYTGTQYEEYFPNITYIESCAKFESIKGSASGIDISNITKDTYRESVKLKKITDLDLDTIANKTERVLHEILNTKPENIMGYLLYNKIMYNIYVYNINIQSAIRTNYLNNTSITSALLNTEEYITEVNTNDLTSVTGTPSIGNLLVNSIKTVLINMKNNVTLLLSRNNLSESNSDFINDKYKYTEKIEALNNIKTEYDRIQNSLNISVKEYNKYITNFKAIKSIASFIVIFLIILIIVTILITILTTIPPQLKSSYYIITFIILCITTYLFYNRFNHVNLYEKFTAVEATCAASGSVTTYKDKPVHKMNHYNLCNSLTTVINNYNNEVKSIVNKLRNNVYTVGNKTFSYDADNYLYKLYLEKKNQNEVNRLKKVSLTNLIESMKKQILYLFNIIVFISSLIIILLLGLMLHSSLPFFLTYIIGLCVLLTVILVVYFIIAIVQPTRMVASKNYWANNRPNEDVFN